jgi:hypothetical protein
MSIFSLVMLTKARSLCTGVHFFSTVAMSSAYFRIASLTDAEMERCWGVLTSTDDIIAASVRRGRRICDFLWDIYFVLWSGISEGSMVTDAIVKQLLDSRGLDFVGLRMEPANAETIAWAHYTDRDQFMMPHDCKLKARKRRDKEKKIAASDKNIMDILCRAAAAAASTGSTTVATTASSILGRQIQYQSMSFQDQIRNLERMFWERSLVVDGKIRQLEQQFRQQSEAAAQERLERAQQKLQFQAKIQELEAMLHIPSKEPRDKRKADELLL